MVSVSSVFWCPLQVPICKQLDYHKLTIMVIPTILTPLQNGCTNNRAAEFTSFNFISGIQLLSSTCVVKTDCCIYQRVDLLKTKSQFNTAGTSYCLKSFWFRSRVSCKREIDGRIDCTSPGSEFESRTDCALRWKLNWTFGNWSGLLKKKGVQLRRDLADLTSYKLINFIFWQRFSSYRGREAAIRCHFASILPDLPPGAYVTSAMGLQLYKIVSLLEF
jgi:hypothetical protein